METQIQAFYPSAVGTQFLTVFGYSSKGVPGLEIHAPNKQTRNLKEKIIYLNRIRGIKLPVRRIVLCVDVNEVSAHGAQLKWLELPILLAFWHLIGALNVPRLDDCICSGEVRVSGEIVHYHPNKDFGMKMPSSFTKNLKMIHTVPVDELWHIDSRMFLSHIPELSFQTYMESDSEIPMNSCMT